MPGVRLSKPRVLLALVISVAVVIVLYQLLRRVVKEQQFSDGSKFRSKIVVEHVVGTRKLEQTASHYNVMFIFNNAKSNGPLLNNFKACIQSLMTRASRPPHVHIAGDMDSFQVAYKLFQDLGLDGVTKVVHHDLDDIPESSLHIIRTIHEKLSGKRHSFSNPMFYISTIMHRVMPLNMSRVILLDVDLMFKSDIIDLFNIFNDFKDDQVIGIARENQPVYRNVFWQYRKEFPSTRVGEPPPDGLTGFNSGVVLFDLDRVRKSQMYNTFLSDHNLLVSLASKYKFRGHLGDQDFFTLISFDNESLFYILPCGWNRQLCTWWKRDDFIGVFDEYYKCDGPIHILHGNCKTSVSSYTSEHR